MTGFPAILTVAPNGARKNKSDHPALPMTPDELAETAASCLDAGAAMIHLHVRDRDGGHSLDGDDYRQAITAIQKRVGNRLIIQATTEAVGIYAPQQQMAMVREVRPEAVSLAIRELVPDAASESEAATFFAWLGQEKISPQYILYDVPDLHRFQDLRKRAVIPGDNPFVLYVLGRYAKGQVSTPDDLLPFISAQGGRDLPWAVCAFGALEGACVASAMAFGGHARIGFENNMQLFNGAPAKDNAALVSQARQNAYAMGRSVANADEARSMLYVAGQ